MIHNLWNINHNDILYNTYYIYNNNAFLWVGTRFIYNCEVSVISHFTVIVLL